MQASWEAICCIKMYRTKTSCVFYNLYKWEADTPQNAGVTRRAARCLSYGAADLTSIANTQKYQCDKVHFVW